MSMTEEELAAAQEREYGTYVATRPIYIRGARAFNVGDAVPVGHVDDKIVPEDAVAKIVPEDAVAKVTTKAGQAALEGGEG